MNGIVATASEARTNEPSISTKYCLRAAVAYNRKQGGNGRPRAGAMMAAGWAIVYLPRRHIGASCYRVFPLAMRGGRGVATGWTSVDISTPLLSEVVPEIDVNPATSFKGGWGRSGL